MQGDKKQIFFSLRKPETKNSNDKAYSSPRDCRVSAVMAAQTSQHYGIERFEGDPQLSCLGYDGCPDITTLWYREV